MINENEQQQDNDEGDESQEPLILNEPLPLPPGLFSYTPVANVAAAATLSMTVAQDAQTMYLSGNVCEICGKPATSYISFTSNWPGYGYRCAEHAMLSAGWQEAPEKIVIPTGAKVISQEEMLEAVRKGRLLPAEPTEQRLEVLERRIAALEAQIAKWLNG